MEVDSQVTELKIPSEHTTEQQASTESKSEETVEQKTTENTRHRASKTEKKRKRYEEKVAHQRQRRKFLKTQRKAQDSSNSSDEISNETEIEAAEEQNAPPTLTKKQRLAEIKSRLLQAKETGQRICIDLSLEKHMSNKECSRLAQQLCRLYGSNRAAETPVHLYFTGLDKSGYLYKECVRKNSGFDNYTVDMCEESHVDVFKPDDIVYLTPDSPHVLQNIDKDKVYIMGGLVDETVTKNITLSLADEANVSTAKLPIEEYMKKTHKAHSKVLSVNQVFDIIVTFLDSGDWRKALVAGVPPRKGYVLKD